MSWLLRNLTVAIDCICRIGVAVAFAVMVFSVTVQILGRAVFQFSPLFTEELTRLSLVWMVAFGSGLALRNGELANVDVLIRTLPGIGQWLLRIISLGVTVVMCAALLFPAWIFTNVGIRQRSPAMGWRMDYFNGATFALFVILTLFAAICLITAIQINDPTDDGHGEDAAS